MSIRPTGSAGGKSAVDLNELRTNYAEKGLASWEAVFKVDHVKRAIELDYAILTQNPDSTEYERIKNKRTKSIEELKTKQNEITQFHQNLTNLIQEKPRNIPKEDKENWDELEDAEVMLRVARNHMDIRLPKARLSLQSLQDMNSNFLIRGFRYGIAWTFGIPLETTPSDAPLPQNKKNPTHFSARNSQSEEEKEPNPLIENQKQTEERAYHARKTVLGMEGSKRKWEMLAELWTLIEPETQEFNSILQHEIQEYESLKAYQNEIRKFCDKTTQFLKSKPFRIDKKQKEIWGKLEKDFRVLQLICRQLNYRLPEAAQAFQKLSDPNSYRITREARRLLGLTPSPQPV